MIYYVEYTKEADAEIAEFKKSEIHSYGKLIRLIKELHEHPRTGTGKPELMKYGKLKGLWSRRITEKHRLVYSIHDGEVVVLILSVKGHYEEK